MNHLRYLSYVLRHRWFVFVECVGLGVVWRGLVHDLSKFRPDEWFAYVNFFYDPAPDGNCRPGCEAAFDLAWLRHQHRNPHHWQHWRLKEDDGGTKLLPMPVPYVKEMLADWRGMARTRVVGTIGPWYARNRDRIELGLETRRLLESLMTEEERSDGTL